MNLFIKSVVPILIYCISVHVNAEGCKTDMPIDSSKKAWCVADSVLQVQSCLSMYKYHRKTEELKDRWSLRSWDEGPNGETMCRPIIISICKSNAKILYSNSEQSCGT